MSIAAIIDKVEIEGNNLLLTLKGKLSSDGILEGPGQEQLTIYDYSIIPEPTREVWGNSGMVIIEPLIPQYQKRLEYRRHLYTGLFENF